MAQRNADSIIDPEQCRVLFDERSFASWIVDAAASDHVVYHRGDLARDRSEVASQLSYSDAQQLDALARRVMIAASQGLVAPLQKGVADHDYIYLAMRTLGRHRNAASPVCSGLLAA
jgi:hypothetical protein